MSSTTLTYYRSSMSYQNRKQRIARHKQRFNNLISKRRLKQHLRNAIYTLTTKND